MVPAIFIFPSSYNFTLCVTKRDSSSCTTIAAEVRQGSVPTFVLAARHPVFNPGEALEIKAVVDNAEGACVQWFSVIEDGYEYIDLASVTKSGELVCLDNSRSTRTFHLVGFYFFSL